MDELLLGIDVGTTATKAALFRLNGTLEACCQSEYPLHCVKPSWVEQNPEDWWQGVCQATRSVLSRVPHGAERLAGLAVSAQAPTLLPVDSNGDPLCPALIWMDRRAEAEANELDGNLGEGSTFRITGNRPDPFYVAAKLRWLKKNRPEILLKTSRFVQITGYINHRLTGIDTLDEVHAGLLQLRKHGTSEWSTELCELCGVTPSQFPPLYPGHQIIGTVTQAASVKTGLKPGTPVMAGTVDGAAAALEAGAVEPGVAAEMTGTSTVLLMPNTCSATHLSFIAMPHAIPGVQLLLGAMVSSGASLKWFRDQLGQQEVQLAAQSELDPYDLLTSLAENAPVGSDGVIFLPYMMGERSPLWNTHARGVFFGLSLASTRASMVRAILEGVAFALYHNVRVAQEAGLSFNELRCVGGGARSAFWNQMKADVLGIPLLLPETSVGAPFGDAILAGLGVGVYTDGKQALRQMVNIRTSFEPNWENHQKYESVYEIFRRIYEHLREDFYRAAKINSDL